MKGSTSQRTESNLSEDNVAKELLIVQDTGEVLHDEITDWRTHKLRSLAVSEVMDYETRRERIAQCGSRLEFAVDAKRKKRLKSANFCKDRMCPACQKRRSLKVFHEVKQVCVKAAEKYKNGTFLMLTLTVPNVHKSELPETITHLFKSVGRMFKRKEVQRAVLGWFRSLEVTAERGRDGYYHPHFHILLFVAPGYFGSSYIKRDRWLKLWQEATKQPEITQVDIRRVKPNKKRKRKKGETEEIAAISGAAAEVGKYATKPSDYIEKMSEDEYKADEERVRVLSEALRGRRLLMYGGLLKEIAQELRIKKDDADEENDDLVNVGENAEKIEAVMIEIYEWILDVRQYVC